MRRLVGRLVCVVAAVGLVWLVGLTGCDTSVPQQAALDVNSAGDVCLFAGEPNPEKAAVAIANRNPEPAQVTVEVDFAALGLGNDPQAVDERTGAQIPLQGGRFTATVAGRSYTFVSLR